MLIGYWEFSDCEQILFTTETIELMPIDDGCSRAKKRLNALFNFFLQYLVFIKEKNNSST